MVTVGADIAVRRTLLVHPKGLPVLQHRGRPPLADDFFAYRLDVAVEALAGILVDEGLDISRHGGRNAASTGHASWPHLGCR